jgi:hypothetical protein
MPGVDLNRVFADPGFQSMSESDQRSVLKELGYEAPQGQAPKPGMPLYGGTEAKMSARDADSIWQQAREAVTQALFGSQEREEAKATGVAMQPTTAEMVGTLGTGAGMALGAAGTAAGMGRAGQMAAQAGKVLMHPATVGGAVAATELARGRGPVDAALKGAGAATAMKGAGGLAAAAGKLPGLAGKLGQLLQFLRKTPAKAAAPAAVQAAVPAAAAAASPTLAAGTKELQSHADDILQYVTTMKQTQGLSGAQIQALVREKYGYTMGEAGKIIKLILGGS